jgi:putative zinc finger protein
MVCLDENRLAIYLDGELDTHDQQAVKTHIDTCARCKNQVMQLHEENEAIKSAYKVHQVPDLMSIVIAKLDKVNKDPGVVEVFALYPGFKLRLWLSTAATLLLVGFLFFFLFFNKHIPLNRGEKQVVLCTAKVEGQSVESHIYISKEIPDVQFIWLEKTGK